MSSSTNARSAAYKDRRTAATSGAKPRLPTSRAGAKEGPDPSGELVPEDSASNAPRRKVSTGTSRIDSWGRRTTETETQKIRSQTTTRERLQARKTNPVDGHHAVYQNTVKERASPAREIDRTSDRADHKATTISKKQKEARELESDTQVRLYETYC